MVPPSWDSGSYVILSPECEAHRVIISSKYGKLKSLLILRLGYEKTVASILPILLLILKEASYLPSCEMLFRGAQAVRHK